MLPAFSAVLCAISRWADALLDFAAGLAGWRRAPRQPSLPFPTPVAPPAPLADGGSDPHELAADLEAVAKACERAGEFSRSDITKATGLGVDVVKRRINVLLDMGWIEREKHGNYRWKGRLFWDGGRGGT
ncbi:MAG: hypothetical protein NTY77_19180 [Elusimicrobia bacterium]|nr:hypothetical protein [Elusimicrobiota bacterium]